MGNAELRRRAAQRGGLIENGATLSRVAPSID
jgi:hypothetical protein